MSTINKLIKKLIRKKLSISTAESCTGGLIAYSIIKNSGVSKIFTGSIICYSNKAKIKYLSVSNKTLSKYGAVSSKVAKEMIDGLYKNEKSKICISTTGVAGPSGGTKDKPVGLVYIASSMKNYKTVIKKYIYDKNDRNFIRKHTLNDSLKMILSQLIFLKNNKI